MINKNSFVAYGSFLDRIEELPSERQKEKIALAILRYGLAGKEHEFKGQQLTVYNSCVDLIDRAKEKRETAVKDGVKGGRPKRFISESEATAKYKELNSWKKVADFFNVSEDTLSRWRRKWDSAKPQNPTQNPPLIVSAYPQNHNVNDNVNVNVNDNIDIMNTGHADQSPQPDQGREDLSASRGEPEKYSEPMDPPPGAEWSGEAYQVGDYWLRDFRRPNSIEIGTVRLSL